MPHRLTAGFAFRCPPAELGRRAIRPNRVWHPPRCAALPCLLLLAALPCRVSCFSPRCRAVLDHAVPAFPRLALLCLAVPVPVPVPVSGRASAMPGQCRAGPGQCRADTANTTASQPVCMYDAQDCVWRTTCCNIAPSVATQDNAVCATLLAALPWRTPGDSATPGAYEPFSIGWLRVLTSARSCGSPHGPAA